MMVADWQIESCILGGRRSSVSEPPGIPWARTWGLADARPPATHSWRSGYQQLPGMDANVARVFDATSVVNQVYTDRVNRDRVADHLPLHFRSIKRIDDD